MNYITSNEKLRESVLKLLGSGFSNSTKISIGVSYSQMRKITVVDIEVFPSSLVHSLIFFYSRTMRLYDVIYYKNRRYFRVSQQGKSFELVDKINRFLMTKIPRYNPLSQRKIYEGEDSRIEMKDQQIQHLKDRLRIQQDTIRSLRNQLKVVKSRKE
jgi:hypothetical protein